MRPSAIRSTRPALRFVERLARPADAVPARAVWAHAAWLGFALGLVESGVYLAWRRFGPHLGDPDLWVNWHKPWMAPLGLAAWAFGLGIAASVARVVLPRSVDRLLPIALVGLGTLSILGTIPGLHPWAAQVLALGLGVRLGPLARPDAPAFRRFTRLGLPVAAGLWAILAVTTGLLPATAEARALATNPRPRPDAPNVVLVVMDTVRADHLGLYGYGRATSPRLDARARGGVRFDAARATTPYTLGTHASLFTGHWMSETSARVDTPLDDALPTLAEHLRDRGYATAGFNGNIFYGSARYGLDRGFLRYRDYPGNLTRSVSPREILRSCSLGDALVTHLERKWHVLSPMQRRRYDAAAINRDALAWIDEVRPTRRPFFLFLNAFDAHAPYTLPPEAPQPFARSDPSRLQSRLDRLGRDDAPTPERTKLYSDVRDAYDDGIAWIDRNLDDLLESLDRRNLMDNTLVLITSDHGEMLGEHGMFGHGQTLSRPVVHVPLIVLGASGMGVPAGAVVSRPVSLRDVPATVLDLIGDPRPDRFPGRSLARSWDGNPPDVACGVGPTSVGPVSLDAGGIPGPTEVGPTPERRSVPRCPSPDPVLSEVQHMPWEPHVPTRPVAFGPIRLVTEGRWAYQRLEHETLGRVEHLYDLDADPDEDHDLARDPDRRGTLEVLRQMMDGAGRKAAETRGEPPGYDGAAP